MPSSGSNENEIIFESMITLIGIMREEREIRMRVKQVLQMKPYQRWSVLKRWLEQLWVQQAPEHLLQALACLFDDKIAGEVLDIINRQNNMLQNMK
jgi:hypothetical protein